MGWSAGIFLFYIDAKITLIFVCYVHAVCGQSVYFFTFVITADTCVSVNEIQSFK